MKPIKRPAAVAAIAMAAVCLAAATTLPPRAPDSAPATECRATTPGTDGVLQRFAGSDNDEIRRVPGLNPGTVGEARPLTVAQDAAACRTFTQQLSLAIADTWPDGTPRRAVAYYKWRDYYVAVIDLLPPSDPDVFVVGRSHIIVYDEHFEQVAGL